MPLELGVCHPLPVTSCRVVYRANGLRCFTRISGRMAADFGPWARRWSSGSVKHRPAAAQTGGLRRRASRVLALAVPICLLLAGLAGHAAAETVQLRDVLRDVPNVQISLYCSDCDPSVATDSNANGVRQPEPVPFSRLFSSFFILACLFLCSLPHSCVALCVVVKLCARLSAAGRELLQLSSHVLLFLCGRWGAVPMFASHKLLCSLTCFLLLFASLLQCVLLSIGTSVVAVVLVSAVSFFFRLSLLLGVFSGAMVCLTPPPLDCRQTWSSRMGA